MYLQYEGMGFGFKIRKVDSPTQRLRSPYGGLKKSGHVLPIAKYVSAAVPEPGIHSFEQQILEQHWWVSATSQIDSEFLPIIIAAT